MEVLTWEDMGAKVQPPCPSNWRRWVWNWARVGRWVTVSSVTPISLAACSHITIVLIPEKVVTSAFMLLRQVTGLYNCAHSLAGKVTTGSRHIVQRHVVRRMHRPRYMSPKGRVIKGAHGPRTHCPRGETCETFRSGTYRLGTLYHVIIFKTMLFRTSLRLCRRPRGFVK